MKSINATILVEPTPKGRARMSVRNGHAMVYTPQKTVTAENLIIASIRSEVASQVGSNGVLFTEGTAVRLEATFYRLRPKSLPKRVTMPTSKPDCDNYGKLLLDALNHFVFHDDSQVTSLVLRKRFVEPGQQPRIELKVKEEDL